jgi:MoaA/NifB/PqqE/SkfB family radical SAM enzyme
MSQLIQFQPNKKLAAHEGWVTGYLASGQQYPITLEIDPTNECPLDCDYCIWHTMRHSAAAKANITTPHLLRLVREAADIGVKSIIWTGGGEPLRNPGTLEAIQLAHALGIKNGMFSTVVPMTPRASDILVECLSWIRIHIDGATPESYGRYHKVPGIVLAKVKDNIRYFTRRKRETGSSVSAGVGTVAVMENLHEIPDLARMVKALGLDFFQYKHDLTLMQNLDHLAWWNTHARPVMHMLSAELEGDDFTLQFSEGVDYTDPDLSPTCHVHHLNTAITATGHVAYCKSLRDRPEWALGSIYDASLRDIFDSNRHRSLAQQITPVTCGILPCPYKQTNLLLEETVRTGDVSSFGFGSSPTLHNEFI